MKKEAEKIVVPTEKLCDALKQHIRAEDSSALTDQMPESKSSIDKSLMIVAADVLKMSAGAAHFAKVSPQVTDIARVVDASPEEILNWAENPVLERSREKLRLEWRPYAPRRTAF